MLVPSWYDSEFLHKHALHNNYCAVCLKETTELFKCTENTKYSTAYCSEKCHTKECTELIAGRGKRELEDDGDDEDSNKRSKIIERGESDFEQLPINVINIILNQLGKKDAQNAIAVSRWIYDKFGAGSIERFWWTIPDAENFMCPRDMKRIYQNVRKLKVTDANMRTQTLDSIINGCFGQLTHLILFDYTQDITPIKHATKLISLRLDNYRNRRNEDLLSNVLSNLNDLKYLYLTDYRFNNLAIIPQLADLFYLDIASYNGESLELLQANSQLIYLRLMDYRGTFKDISHLPLKEFVYDAPFNNLNVIPINILNRLIMFECDNFTGDTLEQLSRNTTLQTLGMESYNGSNLKGLENNYKLQKVTLPIYKGTQELIELIDIHKKLLDNPTFAQKKYTMQIEQDIRNYAVYDLDLIRRWKRRGVELDLKSYVLKDLL